MSNPASPLSPRPITGIHHLHHGKGCTDMTIQLPTQQHASQSSIAPAMLPTTAVRQPSTEGHHHQQQQHHHHHTASLKRRIIPVVLIAWMLVGLYMFSFGGAATTSAYLGMISTIPSNNEQQLQWNAYYPIEHDDDVSKYYMEPINGTIMDKKKGFARWRPVIDRFYDCSYTIRSKYNRTESPSPPKCSPSKSNCPFKSQDSEDRFMLQHFFAPDQSPSNRQHYFVELGALDGVRFSNSYYFDAHLKWGGLLIEGETRNYVKLELQRGQSPPRVFVAHLGICAKPKYIHLQGTGEMAAANLAEVRSPTATNQSLFYANWGGPQSVEIEEDTTTVACLPMSAALSMTTIPYVDFYSIDVEGAELEVIASHAFTSIPAHALLIEMRPADEDKQEKSANAKIRRALFARGFCRYGNSVGHNNEVWVNATWTEPDAGIEES